MIKVFAFLCLVNMVVGEYGLDADDPVTFDQFKCLRGNSYMFAIINAWRGDGTLNPNAKDNIDNGSKHINDIAISFAPCRGQPTKDQV